MYQLLKAVAHMHKNGIFHRDIKPENILIAGDTLKVADFGSCRGMYSKPPYTEYISTRWCAFYSWSRALGGPCCYLLLCFACRYRAPECLLTNGWYDYKMDIWGIGCVFFEVVALFPLFPGKDEPDQIDKVLAPRGLTCALSCLSACVLFRSTLFSERRPQSCLSCSGSGRTRSKTSSFRRKSAPVSRGSFRTRPRT
jgi:serine/threonine protein kinase